MGPVGPVAAEPPSGASSSCNRLSCRGELPREWKSGGEVLPADPAAEGRAAWAATCDTDSPRSARAHVCGCLGDEVRPGNSGCEAGITSDGKFGWPGKKAGGRLGVTGEKGQLGKTKAMTGGKGPADGGGWTANSRWVSTGSARPAWGVPGAAATVPGAGTIPGAGNMGRE